MCDKLTRGMLCQLMSQDIKIRPVQKQMKNRKGLDGFGRKAATCQPSGMCRGRARIQANAGMSAWVARSWACSNMHESSPDIRVGGRFEDLAGHVILGVGQRCRCDGGGLHVIVSLSCVPGTLDCRLQSLQQTRPTEASTRPCIE